MGGRTFVGGGGGLEDGIAMNLFPHHISKVQWGGPMGGPCCEVHSSIMYDLGCQKVSYCIISNLKIKFTSSSTFRG